MSALVPITRQEANRELSRNVEMVEITEIGTRQCEMQWCELISTSVNIATHVSWYYRNGDVYFGECVCSFIGKLACLFSWKMMDLSEPDPLMMGCSSWNMKYCNVLMNFLLQIENFHRARMAPGESGHVLISAHDHVNFTFVPSLYFIKMITFN